MEKKKPAIQAVRKEEPKKTSESNPLTQGPLLKGLLAFSLPYLLACFLQQLYGLADLYIVGQFEGADIVTAVSVGSQFMHMLTAVIIGLAMGSTVMISRAAGAENQKELSLASGNTITLFGLLSVAFTAILLLISSWIPVWLSVPSEAFTGALTYMRICFLGIPIITAYNIVTCIFRGTGNSRAPMWFIAISCLINIVLDYILIGSLHMQAAGAAIATVIAQLCSVVVSLFWIRIRPLGFAIRKQDLRLHGQMCRSLLSIGLPIAFQDGCIQISFLIITAIGNSRGLSDAAAIGIVEKMISFLFIVPSAFSQSLSAAAGQNIGAQKYMRAYQALRVSIGISLCYGAVVVLICECFGSFLVGMFISDAAVISAGRAYLSSYILDILGVSFHFCMSSYFCAWNKSMVSFIQNLLSVLLFRIPLAWLGSILFPGTLFFMGLSAPAGSTFQALFCVIYLLRHKKYFHISDLQKQTA